MQKHYTNNDITIIWQPSRCIHSGNCVKSLPLVFKPKEKPWIDMSKASTEAIIKTVENCPSKALSYKKNDNNI